MRNKITILICTRNRPNQIRECLISILANSFHDYSILVADQSTNNETIRVVKTLRSRKIKVFSMSKPGKTKGLNLMIQQTKSEILVFTDDDCIVVKDWLEKIFNTYQHYPQIAGVFGNVLPYQSESHLKEICPSLIETARFTLLTEKNFRHFLNGNNMSLKKSVFEKVGGFKEWLGVGSIGEAGEESELILRILKNKLILAINPQSIVYHNRWLTSQQEKELQAHYTCGFLAALSFHLLEKDYKHIWIFIKWRIQERLFSFSGGRSAWKRWLFFESRFFILELFAICKGFSLGLVLGVLQSYKAKLASLKHYKF